MRKIKKVCFVHVGPLKYRGRLIKQIETLQKAGVECFVIHGRTESEPPDYSVYDFPVESLRVPRGHNMIAEKLKVPILMAGLARFSAKASKIVTNRQADAVVSVAIFAGLTGAFAKSKHPGMLYVFDSNELFLETVSGAKRAILAKVQNHILKKADVIIHAERRRLEYFHNTYQTNAKPYVLENLPYFLPHVRSRQRKDGKIRCIYLGGFMPDRCCEAMIESFAGIDREEISFDMVGFFDSPSYEKKVRGLLRRIDSPRIRILPPVANKEIHAFLENYDIGLAFYQNTNLNNFYCAPNKVYDYIQMGLPVITNDYPGLIDTVEKNAIGCCVGEIDGKTILSSIDRIVRDDMFSNITVEIRRRYSWEYQIPSYCRIFGLDS